MDKGNRFVFFFFFLPLLTTKISFNLIFPSTEISRRLNFKHWNVGRILIVGRGGIDYI